MTPDPKERLVDPETGETPPLSPRDVALAHEERVKRLVERGIRPAPHIVPPEYLKATEEIYRQYLTGSWDVTEPDDAA